MAQLPTDAEFRATPRKVSILDSSSKLNPREELVALLRGHAACPILCGLGECGLLDQMLAGPFLASDLTHVADPVLLRAALTYLVSLGLLSQKAGPAAEYTVTKLGQTVFTRFGSCALIHSYREFFERLPGMIIGTDRGPRPKVDRPTNLLGSGQLHARKFFPVAYRVLACHPPHRLIDIGCGNGEFIAGVFHVRPDIEAIGVDLSEVSIAQLRSRFGNRVRGIVADGFDVAAWLEAASVESASTVVSLWFVVHEFVSGDVTRAINFFQHLKTHLPDADLIVGEIVRSPASVLAAGHVASIMPEFLLFHALSGQTVFTWAQHQDVLQEIPYTLAQEVLFDELPDGSGTRVPSSFVWHLRPR